MIEESKRETFGKGAGNPSLLGGYLTVGLSLLIYALCKLTHSPQWQLLWFAMPLVMAVKGFRNRKKAAVVPYFTRVVEHVWLVVNYLLLLATLFIFGYVQLTQAWYLFVLMMPAALLLTSTAMMMTGIIMKERVVTYLPAVAFVIGIYMLLDVTRGNVSILSWNLWIAVGFAVMMIIPGHIMNARKGA